MKRISVGGCCFGRVIVWEIGGASAWNEGRIWLGLINCRASAGCSSVTLRQVKEFDARSRCRGADGLCT